MEAFKWSETVFKIGEEKVTQLVNQVLSRHYGGCAKDQALIQEIVEDLALPIRQEVEDLKQQMEALNQKVANLAGQLEDLLKSSPAASGASKRKKTAKKTQPKATKGS